MKEPGRRPNILILYTDQQRWDALGANDNAQIITPHLDGLAGDGVNFRRCFVQNPVCMPSRISFLTGQYPSSLGIPHMGVPVPEDTCTLATLLGRAGYHCANLGKLHFLPHANRNHRNLHPAYGFDHLSVSDEPGCYQDAYHAWVSQVAPDQVDRISPGLPPARATFHDAMGLEDPVVHEQATGRFDFKGARASRCSPEVTHTAFVADQTIEYIERHGNQSFFCLAGFYSPHAPWIAPRTYLDQYDPDTLSLPRYPPEIDSARPRDGGLDDLCSDDQLRSARHGYYAMITEVDHHVGRILKRLDELGLSEDTIVVFTSDHGEWLGDHLRFGKGPPGDDAVARVPLVIRYPRRIATDGRHEGGIVESVDVAPTLLEFARVPVPSYLQGGSLASALAGRTAVGKEAALMEGAGWKNIRTDGYRYLVREDGTESLWDLKSDPGEYVDLAADQSHGEVLAEMRRTMLRKIVEVERPRQRVWPY